MAAVTSRYARAFADFIMEKRLSPDEALQQLNDFVRLLDGSAELRHVWDNPAIPAQQKRALLDAIVKRQGTSHPVRNFIAIIIDHRRILTLPQIVRQLRTELNQRLGITEAEITVARELSLDEKRDLERRIALATGNQVRANYHLDPQILGGATLRIGSTIYDGSVKGQLERLRQTLSAD
jgi:F-type H+-transporting ATPase subunit delta